MHKYLIYMNVKCGFIFLRYSYKQNSKKNVKFFDKTILNENFLILV